MPLQPPPVRPLLNSNDHKEWAFMIGSYMLNLGSIENTTRELIFRIAGEGSEVASCELGDRIGFIRKGFPREPRPRHKLAMTTLTLAKKQQEFRNIVAHSAVMLFARPD